MMSKLPHQTIIIIAASLLLSLLTARTADATVTISSTGKQYRSRPASFGLELEDGLEYAALLQVVEDDLHLCAGIGEHGEDGPIRGDGDADGPLKDESSENDSINLTEMKPRKINVVPSDDVPVAILAKRGQCSYETKARVAQTLTLPHGAVKFLIVYNDDENDGQRLVAMSPDTPGDKKWEDLGLVFVSHKSGVDLHEYVTAPEEVASEGGPRILIDGSGRRAYAPPTRKSLAGLTALLMLIGGLVSFLLQLVFVRTTGARRMRGNRRIQESGPRLLTIDEVETLPMVKYSGTLDGSPSSDAELGDKSQLPFTVEDAGEGDSSGPRAGNTCPNADKERQSNGSGLCVALFREKDHDMNICQDTCSICLEEYDQGECIRVLPCGHTFHSDCIFPWLTERSPTCPLCKAYFQAVPCKGEGGDGTSRDNDGDEEESVHDEADALPLPPTEEELPARDGMPSRPLELEQGERQPANVILSPAADVWESSWRLSSFGRWLLGWSSDISELSTADAAEPAPGLLLDEPLLVRGTSDLGGDSVEMV